ncbi:tyrosine-type recombinase/integrase [Clostridium perfringens]|uniref:tyrosine-type recombinase/integrase n=1 Tax=Clostridium perfringens TaxID=1502 RepID=UPI002AC46E00|nr:tyrosine-type recombinase/integrase [Clostridium perfringens]MDZ5041684.1 tyrosine-type recombinase/integrase [Clostridium perfringens]
MQEFIIDIEQRMISILDNMQMEELHKVLIERFQGVSIVYESSEVETNHKNENYCDMFISSKRVEGCSEKSSKYYENSSCSKVTIDNIRRILSSFFSWLEDENYILKSPVRRIHKIRTGKVIKETYTDEHLEIMRDSCKEIRDLAMIDLLNSTGIRVGELVKLNIDDVNFNERECIVTGKGDKQRKVYFDARTKIHLENYLKSRIDDNNALFVSLIKPHSRLKISGVEIRMRELGRKLNITKVHPHKFRRTLATRAIDKGMPIEQVQQLLGHQKIDTTLKYAMVNQNNIKISHRKFIC